MVKDLTLLCDNTNALSISKNTIQHSRTKHINIWHDFIIDIVELNTQSLDHISINLHLVDLFTKSLDSLRFETLRKPIGFYIFPWVCNGCVIYDCVVVYSDFFCCICGFLSCLSSGCMIVRILTSFLYVFSLMEGYSFDFLCPKCANVLFVAF